ncbi:MAG TPA: DNA-3-methyladenine glycosylase I [Acidimicrobiales bacterium]|nr:DNA-3-methyladenine glycosylase I [Acidimicrobiales bacterium]
MTLTDGDDGKLRCSWGDSTAEYRAYHDTEWGFGVTDDQRLFEKLCLEGFQSGLSWLTILRKREAFRSAFSGFDFTEVAAFTDHDVERLLGDAGIVRHAGKIRSTINNAHRAIELADEFGSLASYFWPRASFGPPPTAIQSTSPESVALAKDLKRRGWTFVGPTTVYAFMQAMGLVNDHADGCWVRDEAEKSRRRAARARARNSRE